MAISFLSLSYKVGPNFDSLYSKKKMSFGMFNVHMILQTTKQKSYS